MPTSQQQAVQYTGVDRSACSVLYHAKQHSMHAGGSAAGSVEVQGLSVTRSLVIMHLNGPAVHVYLFINSLSPGLHHVDACLHCICHTVKVFSQLWASFTL